MTSLSRAGVLLAVLVLGACAREQEYEALRWRPLDIRLEAAQEHPWWSFPVQARWTNEASGKKLRVDGVWDGERKWLIRFAAPEAGIWRFETESEDSGLDGRSGVVTVSEPSLEEIGANPNLHGQVRASADGRRFEYADGTPFLLLADTFWAGNTARAGLGENQDGPFFQYLNDRRDKGFTAVLMQTVHGFGDYPEDPDGHANEGGHLFLERDFERLNPAYLEYSDRRWEILFDRGLVVASPFMWWGKTKTCVFEPQQARQLGGYLAARYGAFNVIWAVSGEYQYVFRDCGWTEQDVNALGEAIQAHNPYHRPLSIHPSGQTRWDPPHGVQSSRPFQESSWLDHHWLQTGQSIDRMFWIVERAEENRALEPTRPVFCSEAYYERADDPDSAYHARWEAWTALLSGCAGYGYGAQGLWQFRDSSQAEPGKLVEPITEWREALAFEGSRQAALVAKVMGPLPWYRLEPARGAVLVDGAPAGKPTPEDLTPPTHTEDPGELHVVYVPRGNGGKKIEVQAASDNEFESWWVNPRDGNQIVIGIEKPVDRTITLPDRPEPDEDWVVVMQAGGGGDSHE